MIECNADALPPGLVCQCEKCQTTCLKDWRVCPCTKCTRSRLQEARRKDTTPLDVNWPLEANLLQQLEPPAKATVPLQRPMCKRIVGHARIRKGVTVDMRCAGCEAEGRTL
jgi:hypothetical protein